MFKQSIAESINKLYQKYHYSTTDFSLEPGQVASVLGEDCIDGCDHHKILLRLEYLLKNYSKEKVEKYFESAKQKKTET